LAVLPVSALPVADVRVARDGFDAHNVFRHFVAELPFRPQSDIRWISEVSRMGIYSTWSGMARPAVCALCRRSDIRGCRGFARAIAFQT
jgi:hypothetical protein